jgi:flagellar biogenesis protein FliO
LRHKLLLVQVDQQRLLLAVNQNEIQTLHAWPAAVPTSVETNHPHAN